MATPGNGFYAYWHHDPFKPLCGFCRGRNLYQANFTNATHDALTIMI